MKHANVPFLLAGSLPLLFAACERSAPEGPTQPVSALYECRGVPGYSPIDWNALKQDIKEHPHCSGGGSDIQPPESGAPEPQPAVIPATQSIEAIVRNIVLDTNCRFLAEMDDTVRAPEGLRWTLWDFRMPDGRLAETGEYYLNTEVRWPDGRKDTTYQKLGFLNFGCEK